MTAPFFPDLPHRVVDVDFFTPHLSFSISKLSFLLNAYCLLCLYVSRLFHNTVRQYRLNNQEIIAVHGIAVWLLRLQLPMIDPSTMIDPYSCFGAVDVCQSEISPFFEGNRREDLLASNNRNRECNSIALS